MKKRNEAPTSKKVEARLKKYPGFWNTCSKEQQELLLNFPEGDISGDISLLNVYCSDDFGNDLKENDNGNIPDDVA